MPSQRLAAFAGASPGMRPGNYCEIWKSNIDARKAIHSDRKTTETAKSAINPDIVDGTGEVFGLYSLVLHNYFVCLSIFNFSSAVKGFF